MINSENLKELTLNLGADLCGITPAARFKNAPKGFKPEDIYEGCKSVIVYAKRVPGGSLDISSCVPYTHVNNILTQEVDKLGVMISLKLEDMNLKAVPIPSDDPYEYPLYSHYPRFEECLNELNRYQLHHCTSYS